MKYIGIDYGTKRIGVAVSDDTGSIAFPHSVVTAGPGALSAVAALIKDTAAGEAVMGESRNFAGEKNEVMEDIEQFKKDLYELSGVPVHYEREFFTSALAARQFAPEEKSPSDVGRPRASRKQNPSHDGLDASAAALILQSYLDRTKKVQ